MPQFTTLPVFCRAPIRSVQRFHGSRPQTFDDVQLGNAGQLRLNVTLQLAAAAQAVEVQFETENRITTSSSYVGEVLRKTNPGSAVCEQQRTRPGWHMGGTFLTNDKIFGAEQTSFAGVRARGGIFAHFTDTLTVRTNRTYNFLQPCGCEF